MGVHLGTVQERDGDYFGSAVNRAARLMGIAHGGQVLVSLVVEEAIRDDLAEGVGLNCGHETTGRSSSSRVLDHGYRVVRGDDAGGTGSTGHQGGAVGLGDPMRYLGSMKGGFSALFANCNRGKQSLRLDIKSDAGREVIENLAAETDVVLCNYRPGVMDGLGLGPDQLCELNPRLIYAAVSGFGTEGPLRDAPAYDPIVQAQAGFAAVQGQGQDGPQFMRSLMCDKVTAYTACQAVTTALYVREKTGRGEKIDLSMMDAGLYFLFPDGFMHRTLLDDDADHSPPLSELIYDLSPTKDGAVTLSAATPAQQVGLLTAIGRLDLFGDDRFDSLAKILANIDEFRAELATGMASFETDDLLSRLHENDVPAARPLDYDEVLAHPQYAANDSIDVTTHPLLGSMHRIKPPARFGGERLQPSADSPDHGQHTAQVLADNGYSDDQIAALMEQGVAKPADEVPG